MKKVPIEEIIEQTQIEPYDKSTAAWCQILNKHRNNTHQMILDALSNAQEWIALVQSDFGLVDDGIYADVEKAIEAASFVEVEE